MIKHRNGGRRRVYPLSRISTKAKSTSKRPQPQPSRPLFDLRHTSLTPSHPLSPPPFTPLIMPLFPWKPSSDGSPRQKSPLNPHSPSPSPALRPSSPSPTLRRSSPTPALRPSSPASRVLPFVFREAPPPTPNIESVERSEDPFVRAFNAWGSDPFLGESPSRNLFFDRPPQTSPNLQQLPDVTVRSLYSH